MPTIDEQIKAIEDELTKTVYNKATQHHIGKLKARLAHLREESLKRHGTKGAGGGYSVKKSGHATVGLVGLPSVGKSTLLNKLTNADSEVAAYDFTTLTVIPGAMEIRGAKIQVLDMPGIIRGAASGRGRGREVLAVARAVDLVLVVINAFNPQELDIVERELYDAGIRVNTKPAAMAIHKTERGGILVHPTVKLTHTTADDVVDLVREFRLVNADVVIRQDVTPDEVIDFIAANRIYTKCLVAVNKIDLVDQLTLREVMAHAKAKGFRAVAIAAQKSKGLDGLKEAMYDTLGFINVYLKPQRGKADMKEPLVILAKSTVGDVCDHLHRDFRRQFRYAQVWGPSAKFPGQTVGVEHGLIDEDVLTIVVRKG